MNQHFSLWPTYSTGALVGILLMISYLATQTAPLQLDPNQCLVTISGAEKPDMLPAHDVWEAAFRRYTTRPSLADALQLTTEARRRLTATAASALEKANALRQSLPSSPAPGFPLQAAVDRDQLVADAILDARDELGRTLSSDEFGRLSDQVDDASRLLTVTLPVSGRMTQQGDGTVLCEAAVSGRDYPHFIPEYKVWEAFFETWASAANAKRAQNGQVIDEYVNLVGRVGFRMTASEIRSFLDAATATTAEVERLRKSLQSHDQSRQLQVEVRRVVLKGRRDVLRTLSPEGWRAVMRRVDESRSGAKWWYRSRVNG